jgi:hypothetical protein
VGNGSRSARLADESYRRVHVNLAGPAVGRLLAMGHQRIEHMLRKVGPKVSRFCATIGRAQSLHVMLPVSARPPSGLHFSIDVSSLSPFDSTAYVSSLTSRMIVNSKPSQPTLAFKDAGPVLFFEPETGKLVWIDKPT